MLRAARSLFAITIVFAVGCTQVSGGEDLEVWEEAGTKDECARCAGSFECDSDNCRVVECGNGARPAVCLPEGVDEGTPHSSVACDWDLICQ